jgi:hypothetical protein
MKLKVFFASDGDCLLLTSGDGRHALIDGGRSGTFQKETWPVLQELARKKQAIDLLVVSHIDADHITGIIWLMERVAEWELFDHQRGPGRNRRIDKPAHPRPPKIERFWHNAWRELLSDLAGPIEAYLGQAAEGLQLSSPDRVRLPRAALDAIEAVEDLAESIPQGARLLELVENDTPIDRNKDFGGRLVRRPAKATTVGTTKLTVIGPSTSDLERLRECWRKWLTKTSPEDSPVDSGALAQAEQVVGSLVQAATIIEKTNPNDVTPPNRASITLLAEEAGRTCLLTGDAGEPELLRGLKAAGKLKGGKPFRCNVVKVQHHGATANLSIDFAKAVLGDHYVFCADGNHHNPEPSVIKTIVAGRRAVDPGTPYTFWFNCTPARTHKDRQKAMKAAIDEANGAARQHPEITVEVLARNKPFFELTV